MLFAPFAGLQVFATASGGRAIGPAQARALNLTAVEVSLLARAAADRRAPLGALSKVLTDRLGELGCNWPEDWPTRDEQRPTPLRPDVTTPAFRRDLVVEPGAHLLSQVTDLVSGSVAQLYDFELSLARMLDGTRPFSSVLESASLLGIPCSLESLSMLVSELEQKGFLLSPAPGENLGADMSRPTRQHWADPVRSLFQAALRLSRQGRYAQARARLTTMLKESVGQREANALLERLGDQRSAEEILQATSARERRLSRKRAGQVSAGPSPRLWAVAGAALVLVASAGALLWSHRRTPPPNPSQEATPEQASAPAMEPQTKDTGRLAGGLLYPVVERHRREVVALVAPLAGKVKLGGKAPYAVRRGDVVATVSPRALSTPEDGWLVPVVQTDATVKQGERLAVVLASEATARVWVPSRRALTSLSCEVVNPTTWQRATCKVRKTTRASRGQWVTFSTAPLWFDGADRPRVWFVKRDASAGPTPTSMASGL